jgi:hypothetical protein
VIIRESEALTTAASRGGSDVQRHSDEEGTEEAEEEAVRYTTGGCLAGRLNV